MRNDLSDSNICLLRTNYRHNRGINKMSIKNNSSTSLFFAYHLFDEREHFMKKTSM